MSNRWSAPAFIKVMGVELGLVGGVDRVSRCCNLQQAMPSTVCHSRYVQGGCAAVHDAHAHVCLLGCPLPGPSQALCAWLCLAAPGCTWLCLSVPDCAWLRLTVRPSQAETLVGVMSDKALDALIGSRGKFNMSSNW